MTYRIRYIPADGGTEQITTVEAHSPSEAVVKVQVRRQDLHRANRGVRVTSVMAEEAVLPAFT
jgi:hypothetical protein